MKIVFLDRDGVINKFPGYRKYVTKVKDFKLLPGVLKAIRALTQNGYTLFVISNQAGISKGIYSLEKLEKINRRMIQQVENAGGKIRKVFYCTHLPEENCDCRKPRIGAVKKALASMKKSIHAARYAYFIGDAQTDIQAGKNAGCKTIFVTSGKEKKKDARQWTVKPDYIAKNLLRASQLILNENSYHSRLGRGRAHQGR